MRMSAVKPMFVSLFCLSILLLSPMIATSAPGTYFYEALIDADNNPSTGGSITVVQGSEQPSTINGIDYRVQAWTGVGIGTVSLPEGTVSSKIGIIILQVIEQDIYTWNGSYFTRIS